MNLEREKDPEILRQAALILDRENAKLIAENLRLQRENEQLKGLPPEALALKLQILEEQLGKARQELFGPSSEKLGEKPGFLPAESPAKKKTGQGPTPQPELPVLITLHILDEADRACPKCGGELKPMAGQYEESDEVTVIERKFHLAHHKRQKYRCSCQACVETAPGPLKLAAGSRYSIGFAVEVAVAKYADHLPLERQVRIMKREGLRVTSQTLWGQTHLLYEVLEPLGERIHQAVLSSPVVYADETPWRMQDTRYPGGNWYVWGAATEKLASYRAFDSRSKAAAKELLSGYRGTVVADGYSAYGSLARDGPEPDKLPSEQTNFRLAGCWAHARRYFFEAKENYPQECGWFLGKIGELYAVEKTVPPNGDGGDEHAHLQLRRRLREERSRPLTEEIHRQAGTLISDPRTLRGGGLFKALQYLLNQWEPLTVFLSDSRVAPDNNAAERALRGVVLGRKNYQGSRSPDGADVMALFYTLMESCKLNGLDPRRYLIRAAKAYLTGNGANFPLPSEAAVKSAAV